jgi:molybdopterin molybdotransferase
MMLSSLALQAGAEVLHMGITSDDQNSIRQAFNNALSQSDIVVSTGGVSVGDFDFVKEIITQWPHSQLLIKGVNIKPGQHITVAKVGEKYFFGLPGFSASAAVTFSLFVAPIIRLFLGLSPQESFKATFQDNYTKKHTKTEFLAANIKLRDGSFIASLDGKHQTTSANITTLLDQSASLIIIDEATSELKNGDIVTVYPFPKGLL